MTTVPSEEANATSNPPHGLPEASLGHEADHRPADGPTGGVQSQAPLPADVSAEGRAAAVPEHQGVDQATSEAKPPSGDKDEHEAAPGGSQRPAEITSLVPQDPGTLQVFVGRGNLLPLGLADDDSDPQGGVTLLGDSQPQERSGPSRQLVSALPPAGADDPTTAGPTDPLDPPPTSVTKAAEENTEGSQMVTGEDLEGSSKELQVQSFPPSPACSAPASPLPSPHMEAPGRRLLDPNLYMANEDSGYMRSMTSLLGGGEGSISSLADILVWSEPLGMTMAMGFLASGHGSPTELLHSTGPSLRSVFSILGNATSAFSSGLATGMGSALRIVTQVLESVERRTMESIRSAVRYLTSHLNPRRFHAGPS